MTGIKSSEQLLRLALRAQTIVRENTSVSAYRSSSLDQDYSSLVTATSEVTIA